MPRRSQSAVATTRAEVLEASVRRASVEGLEGLTIGRLAKEQAMSKSGLFGLFGDKQQLQLATLQAGIELFLEEVWGPARSHAPGLSRLTALCDQWISFHEREILPGGCFMTTAAVEFDARPGEVHDQTASAISAWLELLEREVTRGVERGELSAKDQPADVAFALNAIASAASWGYHLTGDRTAFERARRIMHNLLGGSEASARTSSSACTRSVASRPVAEPHVGGGSR
jgi:AcrR family transcriptional regulator